MQHTITLLTALLLPMLAALHADAPKQSHSEANIAAGKPNIIIIFTDDQTYRGIGYQNSEVKTPHLDRLAAGGIIFERAYVASPICAASRASMMTGRFPQQHGVMGLGSKAFAPYLAGAPAASQTPAKRLAEA